MSFWEPKTARCNNCSVELLSLASGVVDRVWIQVECPLERLLGGLESELDCHKGQAMCGLVASLGTAGLRSVYCPAAWLIWVPALWEWCGAL